MKCEKCTSEIPSDDGYQHSGKTLCEDCYLDVVAAPKACDPWTVYSAKQTVSQDMVLTAEPQQIFAIIKTKGPLTLERICTELTLSEEKFRSNFATLRHMELAKACKAEGAVCYALFDGQAR